ncbi:MAG: hypothetical protein K6U11_07610 [bacterium]|nr:hypothetical protein [bacterium]
MLKGRGNLAKAISGTSAVLLVIALLMMIKAFFFPKKGVHYGPPVVEFEKIKSPTAPKVETAEIKLANKDVFAKILKTKTYSQMEHFHNIDNTLDIKKRVPTLCLICHGNYPHSKNKEVRALYNMHTYFCACETCHLRAPNLTFVWFDNYTGEEIPEIKERVPDGVYAGNYGAKIVPCVLDKIGKHQRLDQPISEEYAKEYLKLWAQYTYDQQSQAKAEAHKGLAQEPVTCTECHRRRNPYLDFKALGYPQHLCDEFTGTEVAGMVAKYKSLKLPTMFRPENIIEGKENLKDGKIILPAVEQGETILDESGAGSPASDANGQRGVN